MSRKIATLFAFVLLLNSCAVQHKTLTNIKDWSFTQNQFDENFNFSYVDNLLEKTNNKSGARWAKRKNIHIIGIRLVNNTNKPIHGSQIKFYNNGEEVEIIHNNWLAKKVRQRISPLMILWLPVFIVEAALFPQDSDDPMGFDDDDQYYISVEAANNQERKRMKANFNLRNELLNFRLANKILKPDEIVNGVIGVKSKKRLTNLKVLINTESEFEILAE